MSRPDTPMGFSSRCGMEDGPRWPILRSHMTISGIRTAALTLTILVVATEGAAIAAHLSGLGEKLDRLTSPSAIVLGAVAGLALVLCRSARR